MRKLLALAALVACASITRADERQADRDRKARVALALATAGKPAVATAPAPREVVARDYAAGAKQAKADGKPLVVLVGPGGGA
ncbi:MAG TPA: hypothetical protein VGE74_12490, partial [Gemmata sp.]